MTIKIAIISLLGLGALTTLLAPSRPLITKGSASAKTAAKRSSPEAMARFRAESKARQDRLAAALKTLRQGATPAREAAAWRVMDEYDAGDFHRYGFVRILAARGRDREAFHVAKRIAHYNPYTLPNDAEMTWYAELAEKAGYPDEAAWARERTGEAGHFRVAVAAENYIFGNSSKPPYREMYVRTVDRHMDSLLDDYPKQRGEIEAMRARLIADY